MHAIKPDAVVIGVDTHKDVHVAVAISALGARLGATSAPTTAHGYRQLADWGRAHGPVHAFGIEGTGSYGAGLCRALTALGCRVVEVNRPNRQLRRQQGKSDTVDAEAAARAVLAGQADAPPKSGDGPVEMIRHLKIARDTALKCRTQAMVTLKTILVNAPQALREQFVAITGRMTLIRALAALRPGAISSTTASAKVALRAIARRWLALDAEIRAHDAAIETLARRCAPTLMEAPGISTGTVAEMLVVLGDNPERIRSEAAFAKLCGVCPIPASSGKTIRHRLNRGGNRRANAALYRVAIVRMRWHQPTIDYVQRRTAEGKSTREIRRCLKRYIAREIFQHLCGRQNRIDAASDAA
ncbi:MAG TPA: IS110 family transposase [Thermoleophilaceae bacterium]|nr:IS110 family transposase [Thermoleophilaceae bacterium]